jgi:aspartate/methionine/tyrosine aminotransferase
MISFGLEDFFDQYEYKPGLINLASSDALPWSTASLRSRGVAVTDEIPRTLAYPDVRAGLCCGLNRLLNPPAGIAVLPTSGAAEAIALVMHEHADRFRTSRNGGIAIPSPTYGAFAGLAELLGIPVETYNYDPARCWAPNVDEMVELSRQCAAVVVVTPHNPTGHVMPTNILQQMAQQLAARDGVLIVDEVFRIPRETRSAIQLHANVIAIGSLSKIYGLPGLRLGWVAAGEYRLKRMRTVQQYLTLTLNAMTVALGDAVLRDPEKFSRADLIHDNRQIVSKWAKVNPDLVSISEPAGGTTVCLRLNTALDEQKLFAKFLEKHVLLAPGARCFGSYKDIRWFRLGYGTESDALRQGLDRIRGALNQ